MEHVIANRIHAKEVYQIIHINYVASGLTHLVVVHQKPGMTEHLLRQRLTQRHQKDRPIDRMEADNVLADQMQICGPELLVLLGAVALCVIADTGNIVRQGIQPDIDHMLIVKIHRDSPCKRGSGYTQIL